MTKTNRILSLPCPRFFGGSEVVQPSQAVTTKNFCERNSPIKSIRFTNAPVLWDKVADAGAWKTHILADEFDLLIDAYEQLEEIVDQPRFDHYVTLRDGSIVVEAQCDNAVVKISIVAFIGNERYEISTVMSVSAYLNDWRVLIRELSA